MQVDFESAIITLSLEDVRQIFKMQFGNTQLGEFEVVLETAKSNVKAVAEKSEELWYPDDSGDWVEVTDKEGMKKFKNKDLVKWLLSRERENRNYTEGAPMRFEELKSVMESGNIYAKPVALKLAR
jgi:hypothetical protein